MANEGEFPKVDGDIFFASEANFLIDNMKMAIESAIIADSVGSIVTPASPNMYVNYNLSSGSITTGTSIGEMVGSQSSMAVFVTSTTIVTGDINADIDSVTKFMMGIYGKDLVFSFIDKINDSSVGADWTKDENPAKITESTSVLTLSAVTADIGAGGAVSVFLNTVDFKATATTVYVSFSMGNSGSGTGSLNFYMSDGGTANSDVLINRSVIGSSTGSYYVLIVSDGNGNVEYSSNGGTSWTALDVSGYSNEARLRWRVVAGTTPGQTRTINIGFVCQKKTSSIASTFVRSISFDDGDTWETASDYPVTIAGSGLTITMRTVATVDADEFALIPKGMGAYFI